MALQFSSLLLLVVLAAHSCCGLEDEHHHGKNHDNMPHMVTENLNVTTFAGDTVTLPCEVANLGHHHVNWLKIQDNVPIPLTVGYQQFSRNMRYRVARIHQSPNHNSKVESWNFEIRKVIPEDQGLYECYVKLNSKHKIKAHVRLHVLNELERNKMDGTSLYSSSYIADNPRSERLSSQSSTEKIDMPPNTWIKLRCNATGTLLSYMSKEHAKNAGLNYDLQWYKDGKLIEQDSRRLKKWVSSYDNSNYMELELYAVDPDDSGLYQCKRDTTVLKNVVLAVVENASVSRLLAAGSRQLISLTFIVLAMAIRRCVF